MSEEKLGQKLCPVAQIPPHLPPRAPLTVRAPTRPDLGGGELPLPLRPDGTLPASAPAPGPREAAEAGAARPPLADPGRGHSLARRGPANLRLPLKQRVMRSVIVAYPDNNTSVFPRDRNSSKQHKRQTNKLSIRIISLSDGLVTLAVQPLQFLTKEAHNKYLEDSRVIKFSCIHGN